MCHVTHPHMCAMTRSHVWHAVLMTDSYSWRDPFICVTRLLHTCDRTDSYVWHESFIRATWCIHKRDMIQSHMRLNSFISVTWRIHIRDMTHSCRRHDSCTSVTWFIHECTMAHSRVYTVTHSRAWQDSSAPILDCKTLQQTAAHCNVLQHT